ncbi:hypothetical protein PROFUN_06801 [Planoprotostelium fungivorum]|uniref:Protein kinase domain-containing protein n=1 Tax=Planoprotostelium fungivorum TaxID=1890364 RepID=A0A2P6NNN5_9EUKA|nr:hypothetical protein PROFUN_06801 [Planoprotostelium fungivorum]
MVIFGAVFTDDGPIIDPYYSINLLYVPNDNTCHKRVAQTICVLRDETLHRPIDGFPFLRVAKLDGQETSLKYECRIGKSLVFRAKLGSTEDVIVKVTHAYNTEAHMSCTPFSPQIRAVIKQPFGWTYVIMDYVMGVTPAGIPEEKHTVVKENINKAIIKMHEKGFVHGDLRPCNILVRQQDCFVYIIDFDCNGKEGEAKYPYFLNTKDIQWPDGVASGKLLIVEEEANTKGIEIHLWYKGIEGIHPLDLLFYNLYLLDSLYSKATAMYFGYLLGTMNNPTVNINIRTAKIRPLRKNKNA